MSWSKEEVLLPTPAQGPIIVIDDDEDDRLFIEQAIRGCKVHNQLMFFENGAQALIHFQQMAEDPFLIFCDINMPVMNGIELRRLIEKDQLLREKSIPFIFLTTSNSPRDIREAYELTMQGFFKKPNDVGELQQLIREVLHYWQRCLHPGKPR